MLKKNIPKIFNQHRMLYEAVQYLLSLTLMVIPLEFYMPNFLSINSHNVCSLVIPYQQRNLYFSEWVKSIPSGYESLKDPDHLNHAIFFSSKLTWLTSSLFPLLKVAMTRMTFPLSSSTSGSLKQETAKDRAQKSDGEWNKKSIWEVTQE